MFCIKTSKNTILFFVISLLFHLLSLFKKKKQKEKIIFQVYIGVFLPVHFLYCYF